jgi:hypothetical protein
MFLLFKKEFHESIRSGRKRQTIRFWARPYVKAGGLMHSPRLGVFRIAAIEEIDPAGLSEDDARLDGFDSLPALQAKLVELYGSTNPPDRRCYKLSFEYLGPKTEQVNK